MLDVIRVEMVQQALAIGSVGFIVGVLMPWAFWIVGGVVGAAQKFTR